MRNITSPDEKLPGLSLGNGGTDATPPHKRRLRPRAPEAATGRILPPLGPWTGPRAPSPGPRQSNPRGLLSPDQVSTIQAPPEPRQLPGEARNRPRRPTLPSACSSEFMSGCSSVHRRCPVRIAAPLLPPGPQLQLPPLTAPLRPSS